MFWLQRFRRDGVIADETARANPKRRCMISRSLRGGAASLASIFNRRAPIRETGTAPRARANRVKYSFHVGGERIARLKQAPSIQGACSDFNIASTRSSTNRRLH